MRHCSPCSGSPIVRRCISNATSPYAEVNRSVERLPITTPVWNLGRPMCRSTWPPINISTCVAREVARASLRVICLKWKRTRFFVSLHVSRKIYIFQRNESRWYVTIYRFQRERTHHCASLVLDEHGWRAGSWWKEDGQSLIRETVSTAVSLESINLKRQSDHSKEWLPFSTRTRCATFPKLSILSSSMSSMAVCSNGTDHFVSRVGYVRLHFLLGPEEEKRERERDSKTLDRSSER